MADRAKYCKSIPLSRENVNSVYDGYVALGQAILYLICQEYGFVYRRYLLGHTREAIFQRQREYMLNDYETFLINALLNDTAEGVMANIERQVRMELEEGKSARFTQLY